MNANFKRGKKLYFIMHLAVMKIYNASVVEKLLKLGYELDSSESSADERYLLLMWGFEGCFEGS